MESRIQEHPILGTYEKGRPVKFTYDGKEVEGYEGEPIAEALKANGVMIHRYTAKKAHAPRHVLCHRTLHRLCHGRRRRAERTHMYDPAQRGHGRPDPVRQLRETL